ncbi:hypothetical protein A2U01_0022957 [Trifolium medium]|uniref:Reverse transcriptase zinc-binding domain-containing protein n=1 Tax=Trifolium medium TaxID=97028 RepID=A0A392NPX8_9FABA|nr:hypothetical protein [Trifolium medium]
MVLKKSLQIGSPGMCPFGLSNLLVSINGLCSEKLHQQQSTLISRHRDVVHQTPPEAEMQRQDMSSSVTVISPVGMWKLEVSWLPMKSNLFTRGCHHNDSILCSARCNEVEDINQLVLNCPVSGVAWYVLWGARFPQIFEELPSSNLVSDCMVYLERV